MRNIVILNSLHFSYPLPILMRVSYNTLIVKQNTSDYYKYSQKHPSPNNFQLTGTWYMNFCKDLLTFSGFADWWREETKYGKTIFLSEPQFWVNLNRIKGVNKNFNLSVGSEVELSNNFGGRDGFYVIPTLALKWTLN